MTAKRRYIFCDIDGTLLQAKGAGRIAFGEAFESAFGVAVDMAHINFAGATDIRVVEQLLREQQLPDDEQRMQQFFRLLPDCLARNMTAYPPELYSGVTHFLERAGRHWNLGLVTGNIRACAYLKLRHGGIEHHFSEVGGFGDDHGDRCRMAAIALERAGNPVGSFLLGDTPSDIRAARANQMISVAVCNGQYERPVLEAEGADIVVDSFDEAEELFQALEV